ncbi:hypothetical protein U9M48_000593 [Paspalum notatum var. saurae]|uniref:DUF4220 domain-containing protein n=1 Tax=Paspalum notatum var. saurae TaxID=547442 RepID=A0AAQ3SEN3_PASNO
MEGCRYLVAGEKYCINKKHPAWDKVTTVEHIWLCEGNLLRHKKSQKLKDVCLSMALSKMLNRRFAGFKLPQAKLEKTDELVFSARLAGDKPHERAFRVIEEELLVKHKCHTLESTICITAALALLEAYQLYLYVASSWFKVALIRSYVSTPFLKSFYFIEVILGLVLRLKAFRPWRCKLGQYCFLGEHGRKSRLRNCFHYATLRLVDKAEKWGHNSRSVKLSENVKKTVVDSLLAAARSSNGGLLTTGTTSLLNNGVHGGDRFSWACDPTAKAGGMTRIIVIWHIATTLCLWQEELDDKHGPASNIGRDKLLHGLDSNSKLIRNNKCVLITYSSLIRTVEGEFWAEMMLYISPSDDAREHLEALAKGGEFITQLWALLTHAGKLERAPAGPNDIV